MDKDRPQGRAAPLPPMTYEDIALLFACLVRYPRCRQVARTMLRPAHFGRKGEAYMAHLLRILYELDDEYGSDVALPYRVVLTAVNCEANRAGSVIDPHSLANLTDTPAECDPEVPEEQPGILWCMYREIRKSETTAEHGVALVVRFLKERAVTDPLVRLVRDAGDGALQDWASVVSEYRRVDERIDAATKDPFRSLRVAPGDFTPVDVFPTGVPFFDQVMGGGQAAPEIYGILGVVNAGKSTLVGQLAVSSAKVLQRLADAPGGRLKHVYLFSWEDSYQLLWPRLMACAARIRKARLMELDPAQFAAKLSRRGKLLPYEQAMYARSRKDPSACDGEYERLMAAQEAMSANLHIIDMTQAGMGQGGIPEIAGVVRRGLEERGWEPGVVLLDSLDLIVKTHLDAQGKDLDRHLRLAMVSTPLTIRREICTRFGVPVWLTNQVAAALTKRAAGAKVHYSDGGEARGWANGLDGHFGFGGPNADDCVVLHCSKLRRLAKPKEDVIMQLNGDFGEFVSACDDYCLHNGEIVRRDVAGTVAGPLAARRPARTAASTVHDVPFDIQGD